MVKDSQFRVFEGDKTVRAVSDCCTTDQQQDVIWQTERLLEEFLDEIKKYDGLIWLKQDGDKSEIDFDYTIPDELQLRIWLKFTETFKSN